jgi:hypothetical protein
MAYNGIDNLKAYYTAKAGMKISLLRLSAYLQVKKFVSQSKQEAIKSIFIEEVIEKLWSFPFVYPLPILKENTESETDMIKKFMRCLKTSEFIFAIIRDI